MKKLYSLAFIFVASYLKILLLTIGYYIVIKIKFYSSLKCKLPVAVPIKILVYYLRDFLNP